MKNNDIILATNTLKGLFSTVYFFFGGGGAYGHIIDVGDGSYRCLFMTETPRFLKM